MMMYWRGPVCVSCTALCVTRLLRRPYPPLPHRKYSSPYSLTRSTYNHDDGLAEASLCVLHSSLRDQIVKKIISSSSHIEYSSPYSLTHSTYDHDDVLARASVCVSCTALCVTRLLRRSYPPPPA
jgi:hypothetical protein